MRPLHIPRHRDPLLPRWIDLSPLARIVIGVTAFAPPVLFVVAMVGGAS